MEFNEGFTGFISRAEIQELKELHDLCYFEFKHQSTYFWKRVLKAAKAESIHSIKEENVEAAILEAEEVLRDEARSIFQPHMRFKHWKQQKTFAKYLVRNRGFK